MRLIILAFMALVCTSPLFAQTTIEAFQTEQQTLKEKGAKISTVTQAKAPKATNKKIPGSYIVTLKDNFIENPTKTKSQGKKINRDRQANAVAAADKAAKKRILKYAKDKFGLSPNEIEQVYTGALTGFSVKISTQKSNNFLSRAKSASDVKEVEQDVQFSLSVEPDASVSAPANFIYDIFQIPSWGNNYMGTQDCTNYGLWAWVLDTGIDLDHRDLNVRTSSTYAKSFIPGQSSPNDENGHGTHCAGIIGAKNNGFGVRGVAAGAWVVPVKVLGRSGNGSGAAILAGLDHVYKYSIAGDVANLSLSFGGGYTPVDNAVKRLASKGVKVVLAAGNAARRASQVSPARANGNNLYTVSAMDSNRRLATFSNYGNPPVDYASPGVNIMSTYKNGQYKSLSGTSMAAPHIAGAWLSLRRQNKTNFTKFERLVFDKDSTKDLIPRIR